MHEQEHIHRPIQQKQQEEAQFASSSTSSLSETEASLSPPPFSITTDTDQSKLETSSTPVSSFPIQRYVSYRSGRPIFKEDPFLVPDNYAAFEAQLVRWIHPVVHSDREDTLVREASPRGLWSALRSQAGQSVNLQAQFHWGTDRIERLQFVIPLEGIQVGPSDTLPIEQESPTSVEDISLPNSPEVAGEIEAAGAERSRNPIDRAIGRGASAVTGGTVVAGRIGAMAASAQALESSLAIVGAVLSCFNMAWAVFNIYREIEGDKAAGLGIVDYTGMLAAWMLNDPGADPHSRALQYAHAMEEHNGRGDIYLDALRASRQQAHNAWERIQRNQQELERIRQGFRGNTQGLQDGLIDRIRPQISDYTVRDAYMPMFHRRWSSRRSFFM